MYEPTMSIVEYVPYLHQRLGCTDECFIMALIYIDRIVTQHFHISINRLTVHRLMAVTTLLAMKYMDDDQPLNNKGFAKIVGMQTKDLNFMEFNVLKLLGFNVHIELDQYMMYVRYLARPHTLETTGTLALESMGETTLESTAETMNESH